VVSAFLDESGIDVQTDIEASDVIRDQASAALDD